MTNEFIFAMNFYDKIRLIQRKNNSLLCVGLDADLTKIPTHLFKQSDAIVEFNKQIIASTVDLVCAYKINLAFYEALGEHGWQAIHRTLALIPPDVITIGDAKRGDIGNSSTMYAQSLFGDFDFTSATVSPYMGADSVEPFASSPHHGVFVLALTSNPGAKDFQYLHVKGKPLYEHVVAKVKRWNERNNCGLVVGATSPKDMQRIRTLAPTMPFLIPGIGAQGGDLSSAIKFGCDRKGEMAIMNASRSILYASDQEDFAEKARFEALRLRDLINKTREKYFA